MRQGRYRLHDLVRAFALARLLDEEDPAERAAAQERLIVNYAELADSVLRLVDGNMSTRSDRFGPYGFTSLDEALRWLDDESKRRSRRHWRHAEGVDPEGGAEPLGALATTACCAATCTGSGSTTSSRRPWTKGCWCVRCSGAPASRGQLGELDKARTTLTSVVDLYREAHTTRGPRGP
ncbi:tetratricopeptide repeat protein [Streptomyces hirsutus]